LVTSSCARLLGKYLSATHTPPSGRGRVYAAYWRGLYLCGASVVMGSGCYPPTVLIGLAVSICIGWCALLLCMGKTAYQEYLREQAVLYK